MTNTNHNPMTNTILRASAGTGKTYQLSNRFLNIILGDQPIDEALDTVLASTFTRKAAGEISDRICTKFANIALCPKKREEIKKDIVFLKTNPSDQELQERLVAFVKNIYKMRVSTLDSYFNKVAAAFTMELGLPISWSCGIDEQSEEYKQLLHEAVRELLESDQRDHVVELLTITKQGKESAKIASALVEIAKNCLQTVEDTKAEAWKQDTHKQLVDLTKDILDEKTVNDLLEQIENLPDDQLPQTGTKKERRPHKSFSNARTSIPELLRDENWSEFMRIGLGKAVIPALNDPELECKFDKVVLHEKCPDIFRLVRQLALHGRAKILESHIEETAAYQELLALISQQLVAILHRERKFRYSDIARRVAKIDFSNRLDSLNHRLNATTKHLLLDEFQDTAMEQWNIIEPIAKRVADDQNGVFFCVGDLKQAIFSWRGGVAEIFETVKKKLELEGPNKKEFIDKKSQKTRRNTQPIVDMVNTLFEKISENTIVKEVSSEAGTSWQSRFETHDIADFLKEEAGFCTLEQYPDDKSKESEQNDDTDNSTGDEDEKLPSENFIGYVAKRINELNEKLKDKPNLKDGIGILVWTNKMAGKIVETLKSEPYKLEVNGKGRSLETSNAVRYILSALKLADHPGDSISLFHLAYGPLAEILAKKKEEKSEVEGIKQDIPNENKTSRKDWWYSAGTSSRHIRRELLSKGYGEVIKGYIEILAPTCDIQEYQCLEKMLELAYNFDNEATGIRTNKFMALVKEASLSNPNAAKIQVMTVFAAKGLEFDMVVLPELTKSLKGFKNNSVPEFIIGHETPDDATSDISFVLKKPKEHIFKLLPDMYLKAEEQQLKRKVEESLSQLYVAMTRAKRELVMIIPTPKIPKDPKNKPTIPKTFAGTLRTGLGKSDPAPDATILYQRGKPEWEKEKEPNSSKGQPQPKKDKTAEKSEKVVCKLNEEPFFHHVPRKSPSDSHGSASDSPEDVPKTQKETSNQKSKNSSTEAPEASELCGILWGSCIHACFEHAVEWLDKMSDGSPKLLCDDEELREKIEEIFTEKILLGELSEKLPFTANNVIEEFHKMCKKQEIIDVLSRSRYSAQNPEVERERQFSVWNKEKTEIIRGTIDRLVVERDEANKVIGIEILDYKSDIGDVATRTKFHSGQMESYRIAMATLFGVEKEIVKATLIFVTQGTVVHEKEGEFVLDRMKGEVPLTTPILSRVGTE